MLSELLNRLIFKINFCSAETIGDSVDSWVNEFDSFKTNVETEKQLLMRSLSGYRLMQGEYRKKLIQFQNEKLRELEQTIDRLNESFEKSSKPSSVKVGMKACWAGVYAFTIPTGIVSAAVPNPFTAVAAAISGVGVVCT